MISQTSPLAESEAPLKVEVAIEEKTSPQPAVDISPFPPHVHVNARGLALTILAVVATVFALYAAAKFFIPLLFGIFIAYTLSPVVRWLEKIHVPRVIGSTLVMVTLIAGVGVGANNILDETNAIIESVPAAAQKMTRALRSVQKGQPGAFQQMQNAAAEIEKATNQAAGIKPPRSADQPAFRISQFLWAGSLGAAAFVGQAAMVVFLVFFLLVSGDTFKRKLVKLSGHSISTRKITVHILDDINTSIQSYMFMLLVTNLLFAMLVWIGLRWIGLENAGAWAVAAGFLHVIPYFGPVIIIGATGVNAFMQFGSFSMVFAVIGVTLGVAVVVGTFVTTWMTGRIARMNAAAVFISLLFWAWLWGIWGMLLGIPIVVIVKVISEHIEGMQPIAELLGE